MNKIFFIDIYVGFYFLKLTNTDVIDSYTCHTATEAFFIAMKQKRENKATTRSTRARDHDTRQMPKRVIRLFVKRANDS